MACDASATTNLLLQNCGQIRASVAYTTCVHMSGQKDREKARQPKRLPYSYDRMKVFKMMIAVYVTTVPDWDEVGAADDSFAWSATVEDTCT